MLEHSPGANQSDFATQVRRRRIISHRAARAVILSLVWIFAVVMAAQAQEISSDTLRLKLGVTPEGIPVIEEATWQSTGATVFRDMGTPDGLRSWVPEGLIPEAQNASPVWTITEGDDLTTAEASYSLANKLVLTWIVELPKRGQVFRMHVRLTNRGKKLQNIETFPAWAARWEDR